MTPDRVTALLQRQTVPIAQACALLQVSRRTIYYWLAQGKIEYVRTAGGAIRIFVDTLWQPPPPEPPQS